MTFVDTWQEVVSAQLPWTAAGLLLGLKVTHLAEIRVVEFQPLIIET